MSTELRAGDIMVTSMDGIVPGFWPVAVGQGVLFLSRRWWRMVKSPRTWWHWRHVAVVFHGSGEASIIQAMPRGVEYVPIGQKADDPGTLFIRPDYRERDQPRRVVDAALSYLDTPYGFATYLKLAAVALRMRATERLLRRWISTRRDMICSQHVDQSLTDAGFQVFDDGRLPRDVVPAELADRLLSLPGWFRIPNHPAFHEWTDNIYRIKA